MRSQSTAVTIDLEYPGHERQTKSFILQIFRMENLEEIAIYFGQFGKRSNAHKEAYSALKRKKSDIKIIA